MTEQPGGPRRVPADGGRADLLAAAELVLSVPPADLSPEDSLARTDAVLLVRARLRAAELAGVRDVDTRELYALGEAGSARMWLLQRPYAAGGGSRVTLARRLETSPAAYAALASGTVATVTVEQALGAADRVPASVIHAAEAGVSGVLDHPGRPDVEPAEAKEAAERVAVVLADGIPEVVGPVPDEAALKAQCRALAEDTTVPVVERLVTGFLLVGRHVAPGRYRAAVRTLFEALLPDVEPGDDEAYAHRAFTMTKHFDGWWRVDGDLTPETGDRLNAEIEAEITARAKFDAAQADAADAAAAAAASDAGRPDTQPAAPPAPAAANDGAPTDTPAATPFASTATGSQTAADRPPVPEPTDAEPADAEPADTEPTDTEPTDTEPTDTEPTDTEPTDTEPAGIHPTPSAAAQRHDALAALLFNRAARPAATPMTIVIGADRLLGHPGALTARTAAGHPVTDAAVASAFCSTQITALITGARRQPLDLYRTRRDANANQRKTLNAIYGPTCAAVGCSNPGIIPHHVEPWHLDGDTNIDDLRPLCPSCHDDIHLGKRTILLRDGSAIGPHGWVRRPPPTPSQIPLRI